MKKIISLLLILTLIGTSEVFAFAYSDTNNDITNIDIRPKHDKPYPGGDSLYYGYIDMDQRFSAEVLNYKARVEYTVTNVRIEVAAKGVTVIGNKEYDLNVGENIITLIVLKPDNSQKKYTIVITREQSPDDNNSISSFWMKTHYGNSHDVLTAPQFSPEITDYKANVENDVDTIDITYVCNGQLSNKTCKLKTGPNRITVTTTSKSRKEKTYTFDVYREKSSDNKLYKLSLNGVEIFPDKGGNYTQYASYDFDTADIEASPNSTAKVSIIRPEELKAGVNKFIITVTAENGQSKSYMLTVNIGNPSTKLASLQINNYICGVSSDTYELDVNYSTDTVKITAKAYDYRSAKVTGNGTFKLKVGKNKFNVTVKSASGESKKYDIVVNRLKQKTVKVKVYWVIIKD